MIKKLKDKRIVIGRSDKADFPDLGLKDVPIKIDTGAYTSAIHCESIKEVQKKGEKFIKVVLIKKKKSSKKKKGNSDSLLFKYFRKKRITSSTGNTEMRYIIESTIELFGEVYPIELSLAKRSQRRFPILIGRKMLKGNFIVDPSKFDLSYNAKKNKKSKIKKGNKK